MRGRSERKLSYLVVIGDCRMITNPCEVAVQRKERSSATHYRRRKDSKQGVAAEAKYLEDAETDRRSG